MLDSFAACIFEEIELLALLQDSMERVDRYCAGRVDQHLGPLSIGVERALLVPLSRRLEAMVAIENIKTLDVGE